MIKCINMKWDDALTITDKAYALLDHHNFCISQWDFSLLFMVIFTARCCQLLILFITLTGAFSYIDMPCHKEIIVLILSLHTNKVILPTAFFRMKTGIVLLKWVLCEWSQGTIQGGHHFLKWFVSKEKVKK